MPLKHSLPRNFWQRRGPRTCPLFAGPYIEERFAIFRVLFDSPHGKVSRLGPASSIRDHKVAAAPQHK